jgi:hypothetical protein
MAKPIQNETSPVPVSDTTNFLPHLFSLPDEVRLSRQEAAAVLTEAGLGTAPATLAKLACIGGGPPFESWGRYPRYPAGPLRDWALRRLSRPRSSTSEPKEANDPLISARVCLTDEVGPEVDTAARVTAKPARSRWLAGQEGRSVPVPTQRPRSRRSAA